MQNFIIGLLIIVTLFAGYHLLTNVSSSANMACPCSQGR